MNYRQLGNTGLMVSEIGLGGEWLERHDAADLALRHCLQPKWILVAQVVFGGEGQFVDVFYATDIFGLESYSIHLLTVERHFLITTLHLLAETLTLQSRHLVAAHTFHFRVVYHN